MSGPRLGTAFSASPTGPCWGGKVTQSPSPMAPSIPEPAGT